MTTCRSKTFKLELQQCACCCSVPAFENMSCLWRNDPVAIEEPKYELFFPPRRFDVKDCSYVLSQVQHGLFMMMLAIRSTRAPDERVTGSNTCNFVVTGEFTRQGSARPSRQTVFTVSMTRFSVSSFCNVNGALLARLVAQPHARYQVVAPLMHVSGTNPWL